MASKEMVIKTVKLSAFFSTVLIVAVYVLLRSWGISESEYPNYQDGQFRLPLKNPTFCVQSNNTLATHRGIIKYSYDFWASVGTPVFASRDGVVINIKASVSTIGFFKGNFIEVQHIDGTIAVYGHLRQNSILPAIGDTVKQGALIAQTGLNGRSIYPHLHFHVLKDGKSVPTAFNDVKSDEGIPRFLHRY